MTDASTDVLIVGAGPTGLTLALDLARRGAAVRIVDKSPAHPRTSRAKGPNPRSLEILADLRVVDEVLAAGSAPLPMRVYRDHRPVAETDPWADAAPTPATRFDRPWLIAQWRLEEILRARLAGHGVRVELGREVVGLVEEADGHHVDVTFADGRAERARYVVGCDGAHSPVRKLLGITFDGTTAEDQVMVSGDVELDHEDLGRDRWHQWFDADGAVMLCPIPGTRTGWWFQAGPERDADGRPLAPTLDGFRRLLTQHTGLPGRHLTRAELLSTYRVNVRMADRYRVGRVLLAGDAAHVHAIAGGLGMNTGIQDAFNLGWKLGQVLAGQADAGLLDTYEEERLPVAAWTLDLTSDRLRATLEAIREPGGNLSSAMTPETAGLGIGYRWSSLAGTEAGTEAGKAPDAPATGPHPGDRAPDAPCRDAATGERTHLYGTFAGPHTTVLGFGPASAAVLREVAATYGEGPGVRACRVYAADEDHGTAEPGSLIDDQGHAAAAYGFGAGGSGLVVIRPDHHVGIVAPAGDPGPVREYLRRLHGAPGMVDAVR
ncbi:MULTISPECIES: FAD-dependent oxidoreductase [unclassified Streptomyces]|uniref:FAD-dependent oxidoreductase n=1 Tax=unclassified Streptomyces TaxID=2593676 RepID=UPI000978F8A4|nr:MULTISPECIES: FAD-dependent oxidoreductase [unclassified Streptomyces]ONI54992.1 Pentachlorophenol 4-monooxygenase [Streptomyces sp. IB2014 011-1]RDV52790.1 FAD-dependent oxidoreductase [Streptomyces sp. IB2014 011-12]